MNIAIPPDLEKFISRQVKTGRFSDPQAVVSSALESMRAAEIPDASEHEELRKAIAAGINDLENGRSTAWNAEEIKAEGRRLLAARKTT